MGKRLLEMIPALLSWSILLAPIFLSFYYPEYVIFFMATFVFLWFFRTIEYIAFLLYSYFLFKKTEKKQFSQQLKHWDSAPENLSADHQKAREALIQNNEFILSSDVYQIVIVATCGEPIEVLRDTFDSIANSDYDIKKVIVILATEERMQPASSQLSDQLISEYKDKFGGLYTFAHPADIPGEVIGKGGNITHAGREITKILEADGKDISNYIVTTLDSDNRLDPEYFNSLCFTYIITLERQHYSYQPLPLFYNNIWDVPVINRMIAISGGFWHMVESARPHRLHNFSSHAQPLWALKDMDFWAVDTIVEDGHQYWRSYFHFDGHYWVEPLMVPIYQDAVLNENWKKTMVSQYKQIRRWAWGASDIPFVLIAWGKRFSHLPFFETVIHFGRLIESHVFWATAAIVITLSTPLPGLLNPSFEPTGYQNAISQMLGFFFTITFAGIFLSACLSVITLPKPTRPVVIFGRKFSPKIRYIGVIIQWAFLPIMTIFFGAIPALEAQTRLFFGKYLGFNVTEKVREKIDETEEVMRKNNKGEK